MNKWLRISLSVLTSLVLGIFPIQINSAMAQSEVEIRCGAIIPGEFTAESQIFKYTITLSSGDSVDLSIQPGDDYLVSGIRFYNSKGVMLGYGNWSKEPKFASGRLSRGVYRIEIQNQGASLGEFNFIVACTLANGEVRKPSDNPSSAEQSSTSSTDSTTLQLDSQTSTQAETVLIASQLVDIGKTYEFEYGTQTKIMKVLEVRSDGWIKVEYDGKWSWLNLSHVVLITPVDK